MTQVLRLPSGFATRSLVYLLLTLSLTINTFRLSQAVSDLVSSASGLTCIHECGPGYECKYGLCQRKQCTQDCKDAPKQQLCGSNGVTYNNPCEMEKARCVEALDITKLYDGVCITLPPPPEQLCRAHRKEWDNLEKNESAFVLKCGPDNAAMKYAAGTLEQSDIVNCYRPQCDSTNDQYTTKQCSYIYPEWCWCSSPDGYAIPNTFQRNMPNGYCSNRQSCEVDGDTRKDGEVYTPKNFCGLCECINGTHTCFVNHTVDDNGQLSNNSLDSLKEQLIQVFNFQFNHKEHLQVDIRHINKYPTNVIESQKEEILRWKFNYYDRNDDKVLNNFEEFIYHSDLVKLFGCSKFFDHLTELMDNNGNSEITLQEWKDFFEFNTSGQSSHVVKREAVIRRKPLHLRKKFHYTLQ